MARARLRPLSRHLTGAAIVGITAVSGAACGGPCEHARPASAVASAPAAPPPAPAAPAPAPAQSATPAPAPAAEPAALPPEPAPGAPASAAAPAASAAPSAGSAPASGSLPEVRVENVGLHVGGGPNDDATKEPLRRAVAERFEAFRRCYTLVHEPEKGGTFGVDLRIGAKGGRPEVSQPRTGMKGTEFRECVVGAFREVEFPPPRKGPTVISYSLRFSLVGR